MSKNNPHNLQIGQRLWYVPGARWKGDPTFVTVTKVGKKWATALHQGRELRLDLLRLRDDCATTGQAHVSREEYESTMRIQRAWGRLTHSIRNTYGPAPQGVTEQDILTAAKLLGIELPPEKKGGA